MELTKFILAGPITFATALAACGEPPISLAEPEGVPGLSVENARLVLAPVQGNPAAAYFDLTYEGDRGLTIRRADVAGAEQAQLHAYSEIGGKAQMTETVPIPIFKGTEIAFEPGGYHVMAFNLAETVQPGGTAEITLTVSGGDKYSFDADVRAAGDER